MLEKNSTQDAYDPLDYFSDLKLHKKKEDGIIRSLGKSIGLIGEDKYEFAPKKTEPQASDPITINGQKYRFADEGGPLDVAQDVEAEQTFQSEAKPESSPGFLEDIGDAGRQLVGGAVKGVGMAIRGAGHVPKMVGDFVTTPIVNALFGTDYRTPNMLDSNAEAWKAGGEQLQGGVSKATLEAIKESTPDGDITDPSTWTMGDKPSLRGYTALGLDVFGQLLPIIAGTYLSGGSMAVTGATGGAMGGGAAVDEAHEMIDNLDKSYSGRDAKLHEAGKPARSDLEKQSAYYRELLAKDYSKEDALARTKDAGAHVAFLFTAPVSSVGGVLSGKLMNPAEKILNTKSIAARVAGRGALSAAEEGGEEVMESVQTRRGVNAAIGTDESVTEGTFGDFILGAIGGAGPGVAGGAFSRREDRPVDAEATGEASPAEAPPVAPQGATQPSAQPADTGRPDIPAGKRLITSVAPNGDHVSYYEDDPNAPAAPAEAAPVAPTPAAATPIDVSVESSPAHQALIQKAPDATDRVTAIDGEMAVAQERLQELTQDNGYGPMFDAERNEIRAEIEALAAERADTTQNWPKPIVGSATRVATPAGTHVDANYAVVESNELVASHDTNLRVNPSFTPELQPRDRERSASELQVSGIVQRLDPPLLGASADSTTGTPVIGADGMVESGNARTIALQRVYQANGQKASDYRDFLTQNAEQFGIDAGEVAGMTNPVLVRIRSTPVDRAEFARQAGGSPVAEMSPTEQAHSDSSRIDTMADLIPDSNGEFKGPRSRDFIRRFMSKLPATEQAGMIASDGELSTKGYARVRNAVLAKAYGDSPILERLTESMDDNLRNMSRALMIAAPAVAKAKEGIGYGAVHDVDVTPDLLTAVEEISRLKDAGTSIDDAFAQNDMFGEKYSPVVRDIMQFLADNARSARRMADFITSYMEILDAAGNPNQSSLIGDVAPPTKSDLVKAAITATEKTTNDEADTGQGSIFGESGKSDGSNAGQAGQESGSRKGSERTPAKNEGKSRPEVNKEATPKAEPAPDADVKWFGSLGKAEEYIKKRGMGKTHGVVMNGKRYEIREKAESTLPKSESKAVNDFVEGNRQDAPTTDEVKVELASSKKAAPKAPPSTPKPAPRKEAAPKSGAANTVFTQDAAEKARAILKAKLNQLNSGLDPEMMQAGITLAGYHIEAGARTFAAYAKAMAADLGDAVKPYLKSWYMGVKFDPRAAKFDGMDSAAAVESVDIDSLGSKQADAPVIDTNPVDFFYKEIVAGNMPKDNPALRKMIEAHDGRPATGARMKQAQEAIEAAIVRRSRDLASNKADRQAFDALLGLYQSQPNLNIRTSTSIDNQAYSTPAPLAFLAARLAGITKDSTVYEPTAGNGMLVITATPALTTVNEMDGQRIDSLESQGFKAIIKGDALNVIPSGVLAEKTQDAVITNPPFGSVKDADGKATKVSVDGYQIGQIDHLIAAEALKAMRDDGGATLILGANKEKGGQSRDDRIFFNWLYSHYNVTDHFEVDGKLYTRQGAGWPVRVITIGGRKDSDSIGPKAGTIERVNTWEGVYEKFQESLVSKDARARPKRTGRTDGPVDGEAQRNDIRNPDGNPRARVPEGNKPESRGSQGRSGNVGRTPARTEPNKLVGEQGASRPGGSTERHNDATARKGGLDSGKDSAASAKTNPDQLRGKDGAISDSVNALANPENAFQAPYTPTSSRKDEGVLIPVNMQQPLLDAMAVVEDEVGDIDKYVAKELGYDSVEALHDALMGLQVDSVAASIRNLKAGKGTIIADQTGIGKGRQAASIIRWALRNDKTPIFMSASPQLFSDMHGDLLDIGSEDVNPLIVNIDKSVTGPSGEKLFANKQSGHRAVLNKIAATGQLPEGKNAVFITYTQISKANIQQELLSALSPNAVFVMDESHKAGGQSATGLFMTDTLASAFGVVHLSATYAKRPDNMPLYFRTDIGAAIADDGALMEAMSKGGLPLQTVVANNLVKAGQMFRRERSYDGVEIATVVDSKNRESHEALSDTVTGALRAITSADATFHSTYFEAARAQMAEKGGSAKNNVGNKASESVNHTEFSSVVHNFVRQLLLGLAADTAADEAIATLKRGEKPLIALDNTMGSFLSGYAKDNGIINGGSLGDFDYRTVLSRALENSRYITIQDRTGNETRKAVPLHELDSVTREAYREAQDIIDALDITGVPVSPLDWIRHRITQAGYTVAEITGRTLSVDYSGTTPVLSMVSATEKADKVGTTRQFNSGELDAIILNVSGSTGISLHASERFPDQRKRHMIVAQAAQDINTFMQMLGRIHRTGQVVVPRYSLLNVDLPAEKRPTAILSGKMKSLNANTSSNTESATSVQSVDMLNKYGDQVIAQYLEDNPDMADALRIKDAMSSDGAPADGVARQATGRMALQPIQVQKDFYAEVEEQYSTLIEYLNKTNQNELEPRTFDFDANETLSQNLVPESGVSPFESAADYVELSIKAQGTPMTPAEIQAEITESLGGMTPRDYSKALADRLEQSYVDTPAASTVRARGRNFIARHTIGSTWRVDINRELYNGVIVGVKSSHKATGNPYSMSKIQVTLAVNGSLRRVVIPASQFERAVVAPLIGTPVEVLFKERPGNERETAKMITGNLLAGYGELKESSGTIINFTRSDGTVEQGILLPKNFDVGRNTSGDYRLKSGKDAVRFLKSSTNKDVQKHGIMSRGSDVRVKPDGSGIEIAVPKSKARGGKFFLDEKIRAVTGDFVSRGQSMVVLVPAGRAAEALDAILRKSALYAMPSMADEASMMLEGRPLRDDAKGQAPTTKDPNATYSTAPAIDTPAFKKWFGDSKVVDADGAPLVVYHGTSADFDAFRSNEADPTIRSLGGFHFTSNQGRADAFTGGEGGNIMPSYLSIKNPYQLTVDESRTFEKRYGKYGTEKLVSDFKKRGFDGFKIGDGHYVAFRPTQIKSAIGNDGNFDGTNPSIIREPKSAKQLYANTKTRPDTTQKQLELGFAAVSDLARRIIGFRADNIKASILGSRIISNFQAGKPNQLIGQTIQSPADLAVLAQVYRDPRFETFRAIYVDATGKVVGESGYTSRLPGSVQLPTNLPDQIKADMVRFGASGYYVSHNHPSGKATPSPADEVMTRHTAERAPGFKSHVVIDHNEYATIDANGKPTVVSAPDLNGVDFTGNPELEHSVLGFLVDSPVAVAKIAKSMQVPEGHATVILTDRLGRVQLIVSVPMAALSDATPKNITKITAMLRRAARETGSGGHRFIIFPEGVSIPVSARRLVERGVFTDAISANAKSARESGTLVREANDPIEKGARPISVSERAAPYDDFADIEKAKQKWLDIEARARGYANAAALESKSPNAYKKLTEAWAKKHAASAREVAARADKIISKTVKRFSLVDTTVRIATKLTGVNYLANKAYAGAGFILDRYTPQKLKAGVISNYGIPESVIDQRALMQGRQRVQLRKTGSLIEQLGSLTRAESRIAYEWMNETDPAIIDDMMAQLPEASVMVLDEVRQMIDRLSRDAVRLGQLDNNSFERNRFAYLHRSYRKHVMPTTKEERKARGRAISILGDQYKGRGLSEEASMNAIKAGASDWWGRKMANGKADSALIGHEFIRFERRAHSGTGTGALPGMEGKAKGKLREVAYHPVGEPIPAKYTTDWDEAGTWSVRTVKGDQAIMWRDFTKEERQTMGEIDEARYAIAKTLHNMVRDVEVGRYFEWLAKNHAAKIGEVVDQSLIKSASENYLNVFEEGTWVRVPDTKIEGTSVNKYGALAGRLLPGPIWNDVRQFDGGRAQVLVNVYGKILTLWKTAKTALSPAVHTNNIMSNVLMADWHDVSSGHVVKALRILLGASERKGRGLIGRTGNALSRGGITDGDAAREIVNRYLDSGGNIGSWASEEIARDQLNPLLDALEAEMSQGNGEADAVKIGVMSALQHTLHLRFPEAFNAVRKSKPAKLIGTEAASLIDLYQSEDDVFRLATWLKSKEDGKTDLEAGKAARRSFMDYHINAPLIQVMRGSVFPFISFTYRAVPMVLETAGKKPHKLIKLMMVAGALNALGVFLSGGDDDEERKLLPEEKSGSILGVVPKLIRMPWNDKHSSPVYSDVRRYVPVGDVFDIGQGHAALPVPPALLPGGPLVILGEVIFNKSMFTGRPITLETDTAAEQAAKVIDHIYKAAAPNILGLPGSYATSNMANAIKGKTDTFGREQSVAQVAASSFGVKLGSYPKDVLRNNLARKARFEISEIGRNISGLERQLQNKSITRKEFNAKAKVQIEKQKAVDRNQREKRGR